MRHSINIIEFCFCINSNFARLGIFSTRQTANTTLIDENLTCLLGNIFKLFCIFPFVMLLYFSSAYSQEVQKPHHFCLGQSANAEQINENFDVLCSALNHINTEKKITLPELVKPYSFDNNQTALASQINENFSKILSFIDSIHKVYNLGSVSTPHLFAPGTVAYPDQINENFDFLFATTASLSGLEALADSTQLNSDFDAIYSSVNQINVDKKFWLKQIEKSNTFTNNLFSKRASNIDENFDELYNYANLMLSISNLSNITKPFNSGTGFKSNPSQISENFNVLNSAIETLMTVSMPSKLLPDTGQTTSYTETYGEDHDYSINPQNYTDNGNGTVTDNNTGLMWQQGSTAGGFQHTIADHCPSLSLAGYSDWRLPSIIELQTIVNFGSHNPAIDTHIFPNTPSEEFWSSNRINEQVGFVVDFDDGRMFAAAGTMEVRCVRGSGNPNIWSFDFSFIWEINSSYHLNTRLMWQREDDGELKTWEQALTHCENLDYFGYKDWRLPNINELLIFMSYYIGSSSINTGYFPHDNSFGYWSSTTDASNSLNAWQVFLGNNAHVLLEPKTENKLAFCIRGGQ